MVSGVTSTERVDSKASAVAAFIAKWRVREPRMVYAEVFCPVHCVRDAPWGALLFELREAAFELSDARLIEAKSRGGPMSCCALRTRRGILDAVLAAPELPWNRSWRTACAMAQADVRGLRIAMPVGCGRAARRALRWSSAMFDANDTKAARSPFTALRTHARWRCRERDGGRAAIDACATRNHQFRASPAARRSGD